MTDPYRIPASRRALLIDGGLAGGFGFFGVVIAGLTPYENLLPTVLAAIAIGLRRLSPTTMVALSVATAGWQVAADTVLPYACLSYLVVFSTAGDHPRKSFRVGTLLVAIAGAIVAGFELPSATNGSTLDPWSWIWFRDRMILAALTAIITVGSWGGGFLHFLQRRAELAELDRRLAAVNQQRLADQLAEEQTRSHIARDVHDVVAHSLAVILAQAQGASYQPGVDPIVRRNLGTIASTARSALVEIRDLLSELRQNDTSTTGNPSAERAALVGRMRETGLTITVNETGADSAIDAPRAFATNAILTEALTNALRHGDHRHPVTIDLAWSSERVAATVTNTIRRGDAPTPRPGGHGVIGMRERAEILGGTLTTSVRGGAFHLALALPALPAALPKPDTEEECP